MRARAKKNGTVGGHRSGVEVLALDARRADAVIHVEHDAARPGAVADWPAWADPLLVQRLVSAGVTAPWSHQAAAADHAFGGRHVIVATGTASGKSLAYQLPVLSTLLATPRSRALYLSPTKALAVDQLRSVSELALAGVRAATYDGDTPREEREWVRAHGTYVLSNPDMLHRSMLPRHQQWQAFFRGLRYVVVDECHAYRGVFGAGVAAVLRRLRRVCARYGSSPTFVLASATVADPAEAARRLTGLDVTAVVHDGSPRGPLDFALYEPPFSAVAGENGAPVRRSALAETGDLVADLVSSGVRTLAFVRSRRGAEAVAAAARRKLEAVGLAGRVAAYRAGYLPEERRALESALQDGTLLGVATTNALELGVDITGLDAVIVAGWPGTVASLRQQAGRAGRAGGEALAVFVARDDPLDTYLVHHPEAVFGRPVEASVFDPENPYVLGPQLACAAAELPLTDDDLALFGSSTEAVLGELVRDGRLRRRAGGWYWPRAGERPQADLRGGGEEQVALVEDGTGRLLGTVDGYAAHRSVHDGAVYVHQGTSYVALHLDLDRSVATLVGATPDWSTTAREVTDITLVDTLRAGTAPDATLGFGTVQVTSQVVSYLRTRLVTGEVLDETPLALPPRRLTTRAVFVTMSDALLAGAGLAPADVPGAAHAAEHAAIGLLPLFATCDRWDLGGVSTALHADTGRATVFVYDGHPGGAGFAERGYDRAADWLAATRDAVAACACAEGCPSCVQSPKCGNGNEPLDKAGGVRLLDAVLAAIGRA
ncbi:MAG: DEAD/DEAH box helicase [Mycobacteriales bacterium]